MHSSLLPYLERAEKGLIRTVYDGDLVLFNYTDQCTYEKAWDEYTLQSRGHIFNRHTGERVARPFDKFFNYEEQERSPDTLAKPHYMQEKMDGSLGIIYHHDGKMRVATRGSFSSDQALEAQKMLDNDYYFPVKKGCTYLVEIIYPENKIIVPYHDLRGLTLLAIRHNDSGHYLNFDAIIHKSGQTGMSYAPRLNLYLEHALLQKKHIPYTQEGWVAVFEDGTRIKVKGDDYMRIAKFKANLSPLAVWEALIDADADSLENMRKACPEEILDEFDVIAGVLITQFDDLRSKVFEDSEDIRWEEDRKTVALKIQEKPKWMHGYLFSCLADKDNYKTNVCLYKLLRPTGNQFVDVKEIINAKP